MLQKWTINLSDSYRYYRIYIEATSHFYYGYPTIAEFQLYDNTGITLVTVSDSPQGFPAYWFVGFPIMQKIQEMQENQEEEDRV
jgi:hypothetical protein